MLSRVFHDVVTKVKIIEATRIRCPVPLDMRLCIDIAMREQAVTHWEHARQV